MGRVKRIWYLSPMRAAKVQASLRIHAVSPEPPLLAHTSSESRGTFRQKARSLALLNGWACAVTICHDGMLEDTNSLDAANMFCIYFWVAITRELFKISSSNFQHFLVSWRPQNEWNFKVIGVQVLKLASYYWCFQIEFTHVWKLLIMIDSSEFIVAVECYHPVLVKEGFAVFDWRIE